MIHYVTPQRSDDPATLPDGDTASPPVAAKDAPPGPISWELTVRQPLEPAGEEPERASSWDAVPHPVGPIPEPPPTEAPRATGLAATRSGGTSTRAGRAPAPASEAISATVVHSLGPVGRRRSTALAFTLAVLTLGLYPVAWMGRANRDMAQFDPRMVVRPGRSAAAVALAAVLPLLAAAASGARVIADHAGSAPNLPLSAQVTRWFVAAPALAPLLAVLLPLSLVALTMTLERVRVVEDRAGVDPELQLSPSHAVWWTAIPVVGLAVFVARAQGRLNRVWELCSAPTRR